MSSDRRISASQANGKLSKGPVTPAGKAHSSKNAQKHGLLSRAVVLEGESRSRFLQLLGEFTNEFEPRTAAQRALVETMTVARWRQLRLWGIEKAGLEHQMSLQHGENEATRAAVAFQQLSDRSRSLELLNRYESRYDRQFNRALTRLVSLRERREKLNLPNEPSPKNKQ